MKNKYSSFTIFVKRSKWKRISESVCRQSEVFCEFVHADVYGMVVSKAVS